MVNYFHCKSTLCAFLKRSKSEEASDWRNPVVLLITCAEPCVLSKVGDLQIKMRFFPVVVVVCISNSPFFVYAKKKNVKNVGARWAGFNISKLVDLPGTISEVFKKKSIKWQMSCQWLFLWIKMPSAHFNGPLTECEADSSQKEAT